MNHHHFKSIGSTQEYLLTNPDNIDLSQDVLISCDEQLTGHGQYKRQWISFPKTLCCSFTLNQNEVKSLTSLEVSCLIHSYFQKKFEIELRLKWPNDLLSFELKKVSGVLINSSHNYLIVGIGLNYFLNFEPTIKTIGSIFNQEFQLNKEQEAIKLYSYILKNRMTSQATIHYWNKSCAHLNQEITLAQNSQKVKGIFLGIGPHGEAILRVNNIEESYFSGSLILET